MASIGHVAIGVAAGRIQHRGAAQSLPSMAFWSAVSLVPDLDVIGFSLGVAYGDPWGHRGATHSIVFAIVLGVVIGTAARAMTLPFLRTTIIATVVLVSHPLLDTLTDGGLGCALFWPFELTRYFAPWQPIPVAPIGIHFLSSSGLAVAATELVLFAPVFLYAAWPRMSAGKGWSR